MFINGTLAVRYHWQGNISSEKKRKWCRENLSQRCVRRERPYGIIVFVARMMGIWLVMTLRWSSSLKDPPPRICFLFFCVVICSANKIFYF